MVTEGPKPGHPEDGRSLAEDPALSWPREMMKYGAEILTRTEELLDALPLGVGGSLDSLAL